MKEKNKGFTLVELLAVIVILALIALIATPIILNVINDAKKQAAKDSAYGYMDAVEKYIVSSELEDKRIEALKYIDEDNKLHAGFHLQALTVKFKEIDEQYSDFSDKQITQKLAMEIIKRSNISIEKIFKEIPADKLINFYEILIKNEREVLKNDIKLYIKRNLT